MIESLKEITKSLPRLPGVYIFKNQDGQVIYVGKAGSLRSRVGSYFTSASTANPRLQSIQRELYSIDYIVTDSEIEALILECNLIKEHYPRYNVNLKDDKDYPYLIVTAERYPRLELWRLSQKRGKKGSYLAVEGRKELFFGPYTDVGSVRKTMRILGKIFPLRQCRKRLEGRKLTERPCLNYQMGNCLAPCQGEEVVSLERYDRIIRQVVLFLQGQYGELESRLKADMKELAKAHNYEQAAKIRDRLDTLNKVAGYQQSIANIKANIDRDVLALGQDGSRAAIILFQVRSGKLLNQHYFPLIGTEGVDEEEIISAFIKNYYERVEQVPAEIILSCLPAEADLLTRWLKGKFGQKVIIRCPARGPLKKLLELAQKNCSLRLIEDEKRRIELEEKPLEELKKLLNLDKIPERIEAYDISHLQGQQTVGGMVVYSGGLPSKEDYRSFNIKKAAASDDYGALQELLKRRSANAQWPRPDLILIDGGRGQLSVVKKALALTELSSVPLVALAKNPDQVYVESSERPLLLPADNAVLKLLQRIRDEVHRYTVTKHRKRHQHKMVESNLEKIPGIGPARRAALLKQFGSIDDLKKASLDDLAKIPGINRKIAEAIRKSTNV